MRTLAIYFVVLPDTLLLDLTGPAEVFAMANRCQPSTRDGVPLRFDLKYVGPCPLVSTSIGLALSGLAPLPEAIEPDALIFVTGTVDSAQPLRAWAGPSPTATRAPAPAPARTSAAPPSGSDEALASAVAWLKHQASPTRRIACICTGALIAARAGLLDNRDCTTHHTDCAALRALAPRARVLDNRLFVSDGPISTSAGVTAGIDLSLQMVADLAGAPVAASVARNMVVYSRRSGHDPQLSPWLNGRNHMNPALHRVQDAISAEPARHWTLAELAAIACSSERHLARLFRDHAGTQAVDYLHSLRIALARELLSQSDLDLERVAQRAGFGSARQMRRVWQKFEALPPTHWRAQHREPGAHA